MNFHKWNQHPRALYTPGASAYIILPLTRHFINGLFSYVWLFSFNVKFVRIPVHFCIVVAHSFVLLAYSVV